MNLKNKRKYLHLLCDVKFLRKINAECIDISKILAFHSTCRIQEVLNEISNKIGNSRETSFFYGTNFSFYFVLLMFLFHVSKYNIVKTGENGNVIL